MPDAAVVFRSSHRSPTLGNCFAVRSLPICFCKANMSPADPGDKKVDVAEAGGCCSTSPPLPCGAAGPTAFRRRSVVFSGLAGWRCCSPRLLSHWLLCLRGLDWTHSACCSTGNTVKFTDCSNPSRKSSDGRQTRVHVARHCSLPCILLRFIHVISA